MTVLVAAACSATSPSTDSASGTADTATSGATPPSGSSSADPGIPLAADVLAAQIELLTSSPVVPCRPTEPGAPNALSTTGTIYYDANQNGTQDAGEPGLPGIPVYLAYGPDAETPAEEKSPAGCTDAAGFFSLTPPDRKTSYQLWIRTGWFRTQCDALTCAIGSAGNNVQTGPEWVYARNHVAGNDPDTYRIGLIPDAGQYVRNPGSKKYKEYPPDLSKAHQADLAVRFTDDENSGCSTTKSGVTCRLGGEIAQTMYIANSGLSPVSQVRGVMQLPYGEVHNELVLLKSGTSPGVTGLSDVRVVPATAPAPPAPATTAGAASEAGGTETGATQTSATQTGASQTGATQTGTFTAVREADITAANLTTITFTLDGVIPPGGFVSVMSKGILQSGTPGTQIVGRASIVAQDPRSTAADLDSAFCATPVIPKTCSSVNDTHSMLDLTGDDNDSDRFNVIE